MEKVGVKTGAAMESNNYLNAHELGDLIDCQPNQFACMARWLDNHGWHYVRSRKGLPKVLRSYHDQRMGINENTNKKTVSNKLRHEPNYGAFS